MAVTSVDVLYALLALDAYNRHENSNLRKIGTLTNLQLDSQVGAVTKGTELRLHPSIGTLVDKETLENLQSKAK